MLMDLHVFTCILKLLLHCIEQTDPRFYPFGRFSNVTVFKMCVKLTLKVFFEIQRNSSYVNPEIVMAGKCILIVNESNNKSIIIHHSISLELCNQHN